MSCSGEFTYSDANEFTFSDANPQEFVDDLALTSMARLWEVGKSEPIKARGQPTRAPQPRGLPPEKGRAVQ